MIWALWFAVGLAVILVACRGPQSTLRASYRFMGPVARREPRSTTSALMLTVGLVVCCETHGFVTFWASQVTQGLVTLLTHGSSFSLLLAMGHVAHRESCSWPWVSQICASLIPQFMSEPGWSEGE